jgi:hypothetical protein
MSAEEAFNRAPEEPPSVSNYDDDSDAFKVAIDTSMTS